MRIGTLCKLAFFGAILGLYVGHTEANAASREPFMATAGKTSQPVGHYEFCRAHRAECRAKSGRNPRVHLTPELWNQLTGVNATVNRTIRPATDQQIFGRSEVWTYPVGQGDCEDVALLKRRDLIELGWPVGALLMTVVRQRNGEGHAVLTVLTDRGDLILDNMRPRILVWSDTEYQFVKRQSEFDSGAWVSINDAGAVSVGSLAH
jgi:predicted transglutaminase-like cysteine proteinase